MHTHTHSNKQYKSDQLKNHTSKIWSTKPTATIKMTKSTTTANEVNKQAEKRESIITQKMGHNN